MGEEEGAAPNRNRGFGNFLGSQDTYALFPRRPTEEAPRPPGAPGDGARTDARLPEASGCGSGVAFPLVSSSGSTRRSRGDRGRLRPRRRLSDGGSQAPWPTVPWGISFRSFDDSACASGREKASDRAKRDAEAKPPRSGRDAAQLRSAAPCAGPREAVLIPGPAQAPEQRGPRGRERVYIPSQSPVPGGPPSRRPSVLWVSGHSIRGANVLSDSTHKIPWAGLPPAAAHAPHMQPASPGATPLSRRPLHLAPPGSLAPLWSWVTLRKSRPKIP